MSLRILMLHDRFAPDMAGGGEYVALERAKGLIAAGCTVEVICPGDPALGDIDGVTVTRLKLPRPGFILALPRLVRAARRADLVHGFAFQAAPVAWLVARLARRPVICEQLALFGPIWHVMRPGWTGRLMARLERLQLRLGYDAHIFLSDFSADLARDLGRKSGGAHVIAPGIEKASQSAPKSPGFHVVFAGQFSSRKGLDRVIEIARRLPDVNFRAVGWWPDAARPAAPANLDFIEARGAAYRAELQGAHLLFFPSRAETFGLVIYEAMADGCAIISTVPGPYAGLYQRDYDPDEAAAAIAARGANPALALAEGAENRARAAQMTWDKSTRAVLALYRDLTPRQET